MPGGHPLRKASSRPCKYGARDADGKCPKKPRSTTRKAKTSRAKAPCKYGPRDSEGRCPKKPKTVRQLKSVSAAGRQAGEVLRSKEATRTQKREAVKVLGTAVAVESGKKVAEHTVREAKKALKTPAGRAASQRALSIAKKAAVSGGKILGAATAAGALIGLAAQGIETEKRKNARKAAERELAATEKRLGKQKLTKEQRETLKKQYEDFYYKKPIENPVVGK